MPAVTLSVASREDINRCALAAFQGDVQGAHISFASVDLLWQTLTRKRWEILRTMTGEGDMSSREVARRAGRDVKGVQSDVTAVVHAGLIEQTASGFRFPYDSVHVDFTLTKLASPPQAA
jgi:predicted transcriptional regulator